MPDASILRCRLPASGLTYTPAEIHEWARHVASLARESLTGNITAHVSPYRHGDHEHLSCDLQDEMSEYYPITLITGAAHDFSTSPMGTDACVPDMSEAMHMAGMVIELLNARVSLGRYHNETNPEVLARPLKPGQTNGAMALAGHPQVILSGPIPVDMDRG